MSDDPAESAYWRFDARRRGYATWSGMPMSERDAFKAEYRSREKRMPSEKTTPVPDELLRELLRVAKSATDRVHGLGALSEVIAKLPSPPPIDPIEEAIRVFDEPPYLGRKEAMAKALKSYRALGCPELK